LSADKNVRPEKKENVKLLDEFVNQPGVLNEALAIIKG
jgi:hypothetical protein